MLRMCFLGDDLDTCARWCDMAVTAYPHSLLKCKIAGLWIWIPATVRERSYTVHSEKIFGSKVCVFLAV